jgi:glycerate kinase
MTLSILIGSAGFKEGLHSHEVVRWIAMGIHKALPNAQVYQAPFVDGGEGFTEALVKATQGTLHKVSVTGPLDQPVRTNFGVLREPGSKTMILEMAPAAGLQLVPPHQRDPSHTNTYGVEELISAASDCL